MATKRVFFGIACVLGILFAPWWVVFLVALVGAFLFAPYYELIFFGIFYDLLYGIAYDSYAGVLGFVVSIGFYFVGIFLRKVLR